MGTVLLAAAFAAALALSLYFRRADWSGHPASRNPMIALFLLALTAAVVLYVRSRGEADGAGSSWSGLLQFLGPSGGR